MKNIEKWESVIDQTFREQRARDNKLTPNGNTLRYIENCGNAIQEHVQNIKILTQLAHGGVVTYPDAQLLIGSQKDQLKETMEELEHHLSKGTKVYED